MARSKCASTADAASPCQKGWRLPIPKSVLCMGSLQPSLPAPDSITALHLSHSAGLRGGVSPEPAGKGGRRRSCGGRTCPSLPEFAPGWLLHPPCHTHPHTSASSPLQEVAGTARDCSCLLDSPATLKGVLQQVTKCTLSMWCPSIACIPPGQLPGPYGWQGSCLVVYLGQRCYSSAYIYMRTLPERLRP